MSSVFPASVLGARGLTPRDISGLSDPYVVIHVVPDFEAESTCSTKVVAKTLNPEYMENFTL